MVIDKISHEGPYVNGKRHGYWKFYPLWKVDNEGTYENDKMEGPWKFYTHGDPRIEYTINYKNGGIDGPWISYGDKDPFYNIVSEFFND